MSEEKKKLTLLVSCSGFCYQQKEVDAYIQELKFSERTARNLASMAYGLEQQYKADLIKEKKASLHLKIALYDIRYRTAEARLYDLQNTLLRMREVPDPRVAKLLVDEYERKVAVWKKIKLKLWEYRAKIDPDFKKKLKPEMTYEEVVRREG